jgi:hypothetical protein
MAAALPDLPDVIPGRVQARTSDVQLHIGESLVAAISALTTSRFQGQPFGLPLE